MNKKLVHLSVKKIKRLKSVPQGITIKPSGLWYSPEGAWKDYILQLTDGDSYDDNDEYDFENKLDTRYKYQYVIKLNYTSIDKFDKNKVLKLKNKDDFDKFMIKYAIDDHTILKIKWSAVALDYAGIEVIPLIWSRLYLDDDVIKNYKKAGLITIPQSSWLEWLDAPSGCVWNPKGVQEFVYDGEILMTLE